MSEYRAQLVAVEARLAKDPTNEELLTLKSDLIELIELSSTLEDEVEPEQPRNRSQSNNGQDRLSDSRGSSSGTGQDNSKIKPETDPSSVGDRLVDSKTGRRILSEAELLAKKKEKNRKKKAKLRERHKEQSDIAETEKQSWQSFASKKGLKGLTKKSIFASPHSVTGKVGVGTNGIADAPLMSSASSSLASSSSAVRRKH